MKDSPTKKMTEELNDDLRPEYDLKNLRIRKLGPKRKQFGKTVVHLEQDVAEVFPNSESVNKALRFLIRVTKENKTGHSNTGSGS